MASNVETIRDEEGDAGDWIELYNWGSEPVVLEGFGLSDSYGSPFRWVFPAVSIEPEGFLIVWASGKDRRETGAPLHTNFAISAEGEEVLLTAPGGQRIDVLFARPIPTGMSAGRQPDGTGGWLYFTEPTPGSANTPAGYEALTPPVSFSKPGGFYPEAFDLAIAAGAPGTVIYYTLDGSMPDPSNLAGRTYRFMDAYPRGSLVNQPYRTFTYSDAIPVASRTGEPNGISEIPTAFNGFPRPGAEWEPPSGEVFKGTVVRAMAVAPDSVPSPVSTATFFVDEEMPTRYSLPVISLTTPADELFDYDGGIYVPGRVFNEWRLSNWSAPLNGSSPANYLRSGRGSEIPAHIEFFEPGGELAFAQHVGVRIHGGWSRVNRQKALRIFARGDYDEESSMHHEIFPGHPRQGGGGTLEEFKRLILHNSGQDNGLTMFRDAMAQSLIAHTGIDTQAYRPAIMFLNGEYWGIHNIRERYDDHYIATNYRVDRDDVVILQGNSELVEGEPGDEQPYQQMVNFIWNAAARRTIDQPEVYAQIEQMMDIDNFIHHYAAQIYYANIDWPNGNLRWWRSKGEPDPDRYGHDGKWRWMMYDTDHGFGLFVTDGWGGWRIQSDHNTLAHATSSGDILWSNPSWATLLFRSLLVSEKFRHRFINTYADHFNSSFKGERVLARIEEMRGTLAPEYPEHARRWNQPSTFWYGGDSWKEKIDVMRIFAQSRVMQVRQHLNEKFSLGGMAPLTLRVGETGGGRIRINSMVIDEKTPGAGPTPYPWTGYYFRNVPVILEALPLPGYRLVRWRDGNGADLGDASSLTLSVETPQRITAEFEPDPEAEFVLAPHLLAEGSYSFGAWPALSAAGTYPPHMIFEQTSENDPRLRTEMDSPWTFFYNMTSRSRVVGFGEDGFGFINTRETQTGASAGYLGSAILALKTSGEEKIRVSWTGGTVLPNSRVYAIRLQYRLGEEGAFADLLDEDGEPVEYVRHPAAGHSQTIGPVVLPEELDDRPYVQLRWKYYFIGEQLDPENGKRSLLRVSDILVATEAQRPTFEGWRERFFAEADRETPEVSGPAADPSGEGVPNLLRYAFDLDPTEPAREALPRIEVGEDRLEILFYCDPAKDIAYIIEASADLLDWTEVLYDSRTDSRENGPAERIRIQDTKALDEVFGGTRFLRLRVEQR